MKKKTIKITQGAMIAALFGVLSLLNTYTAGTFDLLILYIMVIPIVWYGYHYRFKDNLMTCISCIVLIILSGIPTFVIAAIAACLEGLFIGECLKRKVSKGVILIGIIIVAFINNFMLYHVFASVLGINLSNDVHEIVMMSKQMMSIDVDESMIMNLIPLVIVIMSIMEAYIIVMVCQIVLYRLKIPFPHRFELVSLHYSKRTGILLLIVLILSSMIYISRQIILAQYIMLICVMALMVQGLAFILFLIVINKYPKLIAVLAMISIFIPVIAYGYVIIGLVDIFTNVRGILWGARF